MAVEIPDTIVQCDGCDKELNLLQNHLRLQIKAQREVLISEEVPSADPNEVPDPNIYLATRTGRGRFLRVHNFECLRKYASERKDLEARLEYHREDEIYVPEDNRTPEELAAAGELIPAEGIVTPDEGREE